MHRILTTRPAAVMAGVAVLALSALAACGGGQPGGGTPSTTATTIDPDGLAVVPAVSAERWTFEGFPVISHVPADPVGIIFVFHGSGGSAEFADKLETVDALNRFVAAGYGFVATSSTERTGDKRWNVTDPSSANPDLARLGRLRTHLVDTTPMEASTPLFGLGMSNGSRFVTLWGQTWRDAGLPVAAIWAAAGRIATPVSAAGGPTVPTFFTTSVNDTTVPPEWIVDDHASTVALGTPAELRVAAERPLDATRFRRVAGIDAATADQVRAAFVATGVWDDGGGRVVMPIDLAVGRARTVQLPTAVTTAGLAPAVGDQAAVLLAVHQFSAEFADDALAFFEIHRPA